MQIPVAAVSRKNIQYNASTVCALAQRPLIAVVKDDGYGHGAVEVARALSGIAESFAVATVYEGAELRTAGISEDVLVLTPPLNAEEVVLACGHRLTLAVTSLASLNLILRSSAGFPVRGHLAVNTGMNRFGFRPERVRHACRTAQANGVNIEGVFSHYYDPLDVSALNRQRTVFQEAASEVREFFPDAVRHIAATGGVLAGGELFDAVRVGIALYGYLPSGFGGALALKPAMRLYATVAQSGTFTGGGVGYGSANKDYKKLHTLRLGYGDGIFRAGGLGVGDLCMDACVREGRADFGTKKCVLQDVSAYAERNGTIAYEALVQMGKRAVKIYEG